MKKILLVVALLCLSNLIVYAQDKPIILTAEQLATLKVPALEERAAQAELELAQRRLQDAQKAFQAASKARQETLLALFEKAGGKRAEIELYEITQGLDGAVIFKRKPLPAVATEQPKTNN